MSEANLSIAISRADADGSQQCPRCWRYLGVAANLEGVCDRCLASLSDGGDPFWSKAARRSQLLQVSAFRADLKDLPKEERERIVDGILAREFPAADVGQQA